MTELPELVIENGYLILRYRDRYPGNGRNIQRDRRLISSRKIVKALEKMEANPERQTASLTPQLEIRREGDGYKAVCRYRKSVSPHSGYRVTGATMEISKALIAVDLL